MKTAWIAAVGAVLSMLSASDAAAAPIRHNILPNISLCTGYNIYQYANPPNPRGSKTAV